MKRIYSLVLMGLFSLFIIYGCEKSYIDLTAPEINTNIPLSFSADIIPIFAAKCTACHGTGGQTPDLQASVAYQNLTNGHYYNTADPANSKIYLKITGPTHDGRATEAEEAKILLWIQQGAKNN